MPLFLWVKPLEKAIMIKTYFLLFIISCRLYCTWKQLCVIIYKDSDSKTLTDDCILCTEGNVTLLKLKPFLMRK